MLSVGAVALVCTDISGGGGGGGGAVVRLYMRPRAY